MNRIKVTSKMCMTKDVGINGNLFGGNMLAWMDEASAIYAMQVTGEPNLVSVRFAEIIFKHPVKEGQIVDFYGESPQRGRTSVSFDIVAVSNNCEVFRTQCTFVAIDSEGNKKLIDWNRASFAG